MIPNECLEYTSVFMSVKLSHALVLVVGVVIGCFFERIGK